MSSWYMPTGLLDHISFATFKIKVVAFRHIKSTSWVIHPHPTKRGNSSNPMPVEVLNPMLNEYVHFQCRTFNQQFQLELWLRLLCHSYYWVSRALSRLTEIVHIWPCYLWILLVIFSIRIMPVCCYHIGIIFIERHSYDLPCRT